MKTTNLVMYAIGALVLFLIVKGLGTTAAPVQGAGPQPTSPNNYGGFLSS